MTAAAAACGDSGDPSENGEEWLAHVPLVEGAVETDRTVDGQNVTVRYETDTSVQQSAEHYRTAMSVPPWRVTRYEVDFQLGFGLVTFRSDEDKIVATVRISGTPEGKSVINLYRLPILERTEAPASTATDASS